MADLQAQFNKLQKDKIEAEKFYHEQVTDAQAKADDFKKKLDEADEDKRKLRIKLKEAEDDAERSVDEVKKLQSKLEQAAKDKEAEERHVREWHDKYDRLDDLYKATESSEEDLRRELARAHDERDHFESMVRGLEEEFANKENLLNAANAITEQDNTAQQQLERVLEVFNEEFTELSEGVDIEAYIKAFREKMYTARPLRRDESQVSLADEPGRLHPRRQRSRDNRTTSLGDELGAIGGLESESEAEDEDVTITEPAPPDSEPAPAAPEPAPKQGNSFFSQLLNGVDKIPTPSPPPRPSIADELARQRKTMDDLYGEINGFKAQFKMPDTHTLADAARDLGEYQMALQRQIDSLQAELTAQKSKGMKRLVRHQTTQTDHQSAQDQTTQTGRPAVRQTGARTMSSSAPAPPPLHSLLVTLGAYGWWQVLVLLLLGLYFMLLGQAWLEKRKWVLGNDMSHLQMLTRTGGYRQGHGGLTGWVLAVLAEWAGGDMSLVG
jgi:hypothetical protein